MNHDHRYTHKTKLTPEAVADATVGIIDTMADTSDLAMLSMARARDTKSEDVGVLRSLSCRITEVQKQVNALAVAQSMTPGECRKLAHDVQGMDDRFRALANSERRLASTHYLVKEFSSAIAHLSLQAKEMQEQIDLLNKTVQRLSDATNAKTVKQTS